MPRLVRRQPLAERIKAWLNPLDLLLWLSEEIDANGWEQFEKDWATTLGVVLNLVFMIARANSRTSGSQALDDVFGEEAGVSWLSWLVSRLLQLFKSIGTNYLLLGFVHCPLFDLCLRLEHLLHLPTEATLSHV